MWMSLLCCYSETHSPRRYLLRSNLKTHSSVTPPCPPNPLRPKLMTSSCNPVPCLTAVSRLMKQGCPSHWKGTFAQLSALLLTWHRQQAHTINISFLNTHLPLPLVIFTVFIICPLPHYYWSFSWTNFPSHTYSCHWFQSLFQNPFP